MSTETKFWLGAVLGYGFGTLQALMMAGIFG